MRITVSEIIKEIESKKKTGELMKRRVACAHCGNTWIELVGLIIVQKEGSEDLVLRIGMESENCQTCRYRAKECQKCGSKDVYDITFAEEVFRGLPSLSFKDIKKVSRA